MTAATPDANGGMHVDGPIDPAAVVSLVQEIVRHPWPANRAEGRQLLEGVALTPRSGASPNRHMVGTEEHFLLNVPISGPIMGTWVLKGGTFAQVYFQLRLDSAPPSPETTACFDQIFHRFTELYGDPEIPCHGQKGLRRMWSANGLGLDVHYGNEVRSSLMISISDGLLPSLSQTPGQNI